MTYKLYGRPRWGSAIVEAQLVWYGLDGTVAIVVHVPAPAGERCSAADATPDPASAELADTVTDPRTMALVAGDVSEPVGAVLSTRTLLTVADVVELPALSVVTTRRSYCPSLTPVVSQLV